MRGVLKAGTMAHRLSLRDKLDIARAMAAGKTHPRAL